MLLHFLLPYLAAASPAFCPWNIPDEDKALLNCDQFLDKPGVLYPEAHSQPVGSEKTLVKIGLLFPQSRASCTYVRATVEGDAAALAVDDVNKNPDLIPEYHLELVTIEQYKNCSRSYDTLGYAYLLKYNRDVKVLVGPACGDKSSGQSVASFAAAENLPVISVAAFSDELDNVEKYPTFTRIFESSIIQAYYHAAIYEYFAWNHVAVIKERTTAKPMCTEKYKAIPDRLRSLNYTVKEYLLTDEGRLEDNDLVEIMENSRVISIFSGPHLSRQFILDAYRYCDVNMSRCDWSDYRIVTMNYQLGTLINNTNISPWMCDQTLRVNKLRKLCKCCSEAEKGEDDEARLAFKSVIQIANAIPKFTKQREFHCKMMKKIGKEQGVTCIEETTLIQHVYDAVLVYAHALNKTKDPEDGRGISDATKTLQIEGMSGRIMGNEIGSRYTDALAFFLLDDDDEMTSMLSLTADRKTGIYTAKLIDKAPSSVPDLPPCPWYDVKCGQIQTILGSVGGALVLIILLATTFKIWMYMKHGSENSFILTSDELKKLQLNSRDKKVCDIHVKITDVSITLKDKETINTLRELHQIHHSNILKFLYCCLEPANIVLITENCTKGNLQYLILTEEKVQTSTFVKSFALDIVKGLCYLHDSVFCYHGSLTSLHCLVDARWTIKLTGFYRKDLASSYYKEDIYYNDCVEMRTWDEETINSDLYGQLWMSPQYLNRDISDVEGHRSNDVFSFGVVLSELLSGTGPYGLVMSLDEDIGSAISAQLSRIKLGDASQQDIAPASLSTPQYSEISQPQPTEASQPQPTEASQPQPTEASHPNGTAGLCDTQSHPTPQDDTSDASFQDDTLPANDSSSETSSFKMTYLSSQESFPVTQSQYSFQSLHPDEDLSIIREMFRECTSTRTTARPALKTLSATLQRGSQTLSPSLGTVLDQWLITLEKRSGELKERFDLQNDDMRMEKERTQDLVYALLPREIAEQKMGGQTVTPQCFSNCSYFYSDIKGFTKIVADLPGGPLQVVSMLDNLYSIMDNAINKYKVVKVETIGDAYVVASGLPIPDINGTIHAKEIAAFALEVISTTKDIVVPELDNRPVFMRIGIHSGGCVAGVAGNTMFHYCIYGKEPRYANSLESSGEASRIHMSNDMRKILEHSYPSEFYYVERKPSVSIAGFKNKSQRTWWLTGEAGVSRDMPCDKIYQTSEAGNKRNISQASIVNPKLKLKGAAKFKAHTLGRTAGKKMRTMSDSVSTVTDHLSTTSTNLDCS